MAKLKEEAGEEEREKTYLEIIDSRNGPSPYSEELDIDPSPRSLIVFRRFVSYRRR